MELGLRKSATVHRKCVNVRIIDCQSRNTDRDWCILYCTAGCFNNLMRLAQCQQALFLAETSASNYVYKHSTGTFTFGIHTD